LATNGNQNYNLYFTNYDFVNIFSFSVYNYKDGELYLMSLYTRCIRLWWILMSNIFCIYYSVTQTAEVKVKLPKGVAKLAVL